jgi:hypothetical protein
MSPFIANYLYTNSNKTKRLSKYYNSPLKIPKIILEKIIFSTSLLCNIRPI